MTQQACVISQLSLEFPSKVMFQQLNFSLESHQVSALIGRNGQGKSLLMQMLNQMLKSDSILTSGQISWHVKHAYLPQLHRLAAQTIAEPLDILDVYHVFKRVEQGVANFDDYDFLEGKWDLPTLWNNLLESAGLPTDLDFPVKNLSEGQKTKLALSCLFLKSDHYLLLDEPSNHLDQESRKWLIDHLRKHPAGALIISHDRNLLNEVDHIYHLNEHGLHHTTGNYEKFYGQYQTHVAALEQSVQQGQRDVKHMKQKQHEVLMKAQKRERAGNKLRESNSQAKILLDFKKEQAGQSIAAIQSQHQRQISNSQNDLTDKKMRLETVKPQQFVFPTFHKKSGEILRIKKLKLKYGTQKPIDLAVQAAEKIHITGQNGIGKSTLLKAIQAQNIHPCDSIHLSVECFYLDQNFSFLCDEMTVIENLSHMNSEVSELEWRNLLGQLRIRGDKGTQLLSQLSGGEKLKVALLALSQIRPAPELLLLDEPENHLDIESRELLATAIQSYEGAVLLISHDQTFVESCAIHESFSLGD
ncbi:ATP-binding cassette domain-containing protein [Acinetobacter oleivorans]|uniref:ATP-binding cassette domain-containing protein n=1 Tax=Acinetobacter oleivorans TaxID=1148157 RepID=UPI0015800D07|nr:ATP-binding cassette domain-containing protein [Acinetobacter oleivorans]NUG02157.1 ABC-F family ATP-binding cassette domain-containing protein [Acinetobacter oleivorans]